MASLRKWGERLEQVIRRTARGYNWFGTAVVSLIALLICIDVFARRFLNHPLPGSYEIISVSFAVIVFSAFAQVQAEAGHLRMDLVVDHLRGRVRDWTEMFDRVVQLTFCGFIVVSTGADFIEGYRYGSAFWGVLGIPMTIPMGAVVLGAFLTGLVAIYQVVRIAQKSFFSLSKDSSPGNKQSNESQKVLEGKLQ